MVERQLRYAEVAAGHLILTRTDIHHRPERAGYNATTAQGRGREGKDAVSECRGK